MSLINVPSDIDSLADAFQKKGFTRYNKITKQVLHLRRGKKHLRVRWYCLPYEYSINGKTVSREEFMKEVGM